MPVKLRLELMTPVRADVRDPKQELVDHVTYKITSVGLVMPADVDNGTRNDNLDR